MPEKFQHQEYRDQLSKDLKNIEGHEDRKEALKSEKESWRYKAAKEAHKRDALAGNWLPAEKRFNNVLLDKYIKKVGEKVNRETAAKELLDSLKAIDEAFENGIVYDGWGLAKFLNDKKGKDTLRKEYNLKAFYEYIDDIINRMKKLAGYFEYEFEVRREVGIERVAECEGDHDMGRGSVYHPTGFECSETRKGQGSRSANLEVERLNKILLLIEKFKKTPEQIEEEKIKKEKDQELQYRQKKYIDMGN